MHEFDPMYTLRGNCMPDAVLEASAQKGLLREWVTQSVALIEEESPGKPLRFKAKVQEADSINQNGRVYPRNLLEREITKVNDNLAKRPGAVNHPDGFSASVRDLGVAWKSFEMQGNDVYGIGEIIPTQSGKDLEAIMRSGVEIGFSSRGWGTSKMDEWNGERALIIQDDYELYTVDAVTDPSVYDARVAALESLNVDELMAENPGAVQAIANAVQERLSMTKTAAEKKEGLEVVVQPDQPNDGNPQETVKVSQEDSESAAAAEGNAEGEPKQDEETEEETPAEESTEADNKQGELETKVSELETQTGELTASLETKTAEVTALQEKVTKMEAIVKEATSDAMDAINSIINIIKQELADMDFYDVASLAYMCASLARYTGAEDAMDAMMGMEDSERKVDYKPLIDAIQKMADKLSDESLDDYIEKKLTGENKAFANAVSEELKSCTTRAEIDSKFETAKRLIGKIRTMEPEGKGLVLDLEPATPLTKAEEYVVAGRLSTKRPARFTISGENL